MRRWCRDRGVEFAEFSQTGVTRRLSTRDDFSKRYNAWVSAPQRPLPPPEAFRDRLVRAPGGDDDVDGASVCDRLVPPEDLGLAHADDRADRQRGGESRALDLVVSFLKVRGAGYSAAISSPLTSWDSCSRLSPYLSFGNVGLRHLSQALATRQGELRRDKTTGPWLKSLAAFQSRLRWRSHFVQKLETEPEMEETAQCRAYDNLRREPGDHDAALYEAWATGRTGFPMVDACMRCLLAHGWLNFRMRAMLVSFACWNLWLDWRSIAPHLARCFLDYEPGIHYPQLQMQAGTTGINAMRVYSVTKQGKDQDPAGAFIKRHVPELRAVPAKHVHEPSLMPPEVAQACGFVLGATYPRPVVDEKASAKRAKARVTAVKRLDETKREAREVYVRHGSRARRDAKDDAAAFSEERPAKRARGRPAALAPGQTTLAFPRRTEAVICLDGSDDDDAPAAGPWTCRACTFLNDKPHAPVCGVCATSRE